MAVAGAVAAALALPAGDARADLKLVHPGAVLFSPAPCLDPNDPGPLDAVEPQAGPVPADPVVPGRVIVRFRAEAGARLAALRRDADGCLETGLLDVDRVHHALSVRSIESPFRTSLPSTLAETRVLSYNAPVDPEDAAALLTASGSVLWAEPDRLRRVDLDPNDSSFRINQWHLLTVQAPQAWDHNVGDPNVIIAVIDTGLDIAHQDLAANVWINGAEAAGSPGIDDDGNGYVDDVNGYDFVTVPASSVAPGEDPGPPDADVADMVGHGTIVSGVAAAVTNNAKSGSNIAGACWNCRIMPLRAGFMSSGGVGLVQISAMAEALAYAADNGARIVNMSFSGRTSSFLDQASIAYARRRGLVLAAAAGNVQCGSNGCEVPTEPAYPAAYPGVIAVAATDATDQKSWFSKYGTWVDISAPGEGIISTQPLGRYGTVQGTSVSAPLVAGIAGLLLARTPSLEAEAVTDRIKGGAANIDLYNPPFVGLLGAGRLDAYRALIGDMIGVTNPVADPNAPPPAYTVTGVTVEPAAPWMTFTTTLPVPVLPGATAFLEPRASLSGLSCGVNTAAVEILTDDPNRPSLPAQVSVRLDCDRDDDGYECLEMGGDDCEDANPFTSPAAPEVCDGPAACTGAGGEDEDCDGGVDEICSCTGKPFAPVLSVFVVDSDRIVRIAWLDRSDNEKGFRIFRRRGLGRLRLLATLPADTLSFDDGTVERGRTYQYHIRAYNRKGSSERVTTSTVLIP